MPDPDESNLAEYIEGRPAVSKPVAILLAVLIIVAAVTATLWLMDFRSLLSPGNLQSGKADYLEMDFDEFLSRTCSRREGQQGAQCEHLEKRFCNTTAVWRANAAFIESGNNLAAARFGNQFLSQCGDEPNIAYQTVQSWYRLTEYGRARDVLNMRPDRLRSSHQFATWSGFVAEAEGDLQRAAEDFANALVLFPVADQSRIGGVQFRYLSDVLEKLGRYCEARATIFRYVGHDPAGRLTDDVRSLLDRLEAAGNCESDVNPQGGAVPLKRLGNLLLVEAKINGSAVTFILDTGAETTLVTSEFARGIGLPLDEAIPISVAGIGGRKHGLLANVESIMVGGATAFDSPALVVNDDDGLFAEGVDGLLGQSFLSRFGYSIKGNELELVNWQ